MTLQRIAALTTALEIVIAVSALKSSRLVAVKIHDAISKTVDVVVVGKFCAKAI